MHGAPPTSLWAATFDPPARPPSALPDDVDVLVVGAGYTGLWTAHGLARLAPDLSVAVIDRDGVGAGASGRNGGWCSALLPVGIGALARAHGRRPAVDLYRAMFATVGEVVSFAGPDIAHRGGTISLARSPAQHARLTAEAAELAGFGIGDDDVRLVGRSEAEATCNATGVSGGLFSPHCAAVHPLALAHALADDVARRGVTIVEGCALERVTPGSGRGRRLLAVTTAGPVCADVVVLATEAYTASLPGRRRELLPLYSMMIGSEPLDDEQWAAIGLGDRTTFGDARRTVIYGQRTADGRLAFGGRGAPYHLGSRVEDRFDHDERVRRHLGATVAELFPSLGGVRFPFHWGGALGVPRDWHPFVRFDPASGLAAAGGYVGDGVATANLAGRTLADLILGRDTDLTRLCWVGHRARRWEPEPLRWLGVHLAAVAARKADAADAGGRRSAAAWDGVFRAVT